MFAFRYARPFRAGALHHVTTLALGAVFALVVAGVAQAAGTRSSQADEQVFAAIDADVAERMRQLRLPGVALGIVKGDQIVHLAAFGNADDSGWEATPQTPFYIGSTGKSFTALAIMQLVEAGEIDLDAPVQRYIPWFRVADADASARITVRHLLNQTSRIPNKNGYFWLEDSGPDALENGVR